MLKEYTTLEMTEVEINAQSCILSASFSSTNNDDYDYEQFDWE